MSEPYDIGEAEEAIKHLAKPLFNRAGVEIVCKWEINIKNSPTLREWLFTGGKTYQRTHDGWPCFWIAAWVQVLGLQVGAGVFYLFKRKKSNETTTG